MDTDAQIFKKCLDQALSGDIIDECEYYREGTTYAEDGLVVDEYFKMLMDGLAENLFPAEILAIANEAIRRERERSAAGA